MPVVLGTLAFLYFWGVEDHDLWTPDEQRVASVGRQVSEGAWAVPTLNGEPFLEEPPLHAWCVALFYESFGVEPARRARWVSVAFGIAGLAVAYSLASALAGRRRVGLLAALTLGLSFEYFSTSHRVVVDGALTFFALLSALGCVRGLTAIALPARLGWLTLGYASASAAFLAKGPIGIAAPALAVVAWVIVARDWKVLVRAHAWLAPLCFAVVAGPWLWALHLQTGSQGLETLLVDNLLGRILPAEDGTRSHLQGPFFYFEALPLDLLPAAAFVVGGVLDRILRRKCLGPEECRIYDFGLVWLGLGFIMLTVASTKRQVYLLPFLPAAAFVGGVWLEAYLSGKADGLFERWFGYVLSVSLVGFGLAMPISRAFLQGVSMPWALGGAAVACGVAVWTFLQARVGRREANLTGWLAGLAAAALAASFALVPPLDALKSLTGVTRRIAELVPKDRPICAFGADETTRGMFPLYSGRPLQMLDGLPDLEKELQRSGEAYMIVVEKRGRRHKAMDLLDPHNPELLLEDIREESRAFRLFRVK